MTGPTGSGGSHRGARRAPRRTRPVGGAASRRPGVAAVLAVLLPLATVGTGLAIDAPGPTGPTGGGPSAVALTEQTLVCPQPDDPAPVTVGRDPDTAGGDVEVLAPRATTPVSETLEPPVGGTAGPVTVAESSAVVTATGDAAPGLLAARFGTEEVAGTACAPPAADQWFTALGAGAERSSVIRLANPDTGSAVADLTLLGPDGPLDVPDVEGVAVGPGEQVELDLGAIAPTEGDLAARVEVRRGRLGVAVLDRATPIAGDATSEWVPAQEAPARTLLLPGLVAGSGGRSLVVANPGEDEVQVRLQVVTPTGTVRPVDVRDLQVPAGGVQVIALGPQLASQVDDGAGGLRLEASAPVTATLRSVVRGDLALSAAQPATSTGTGATSALVPEGDSRVVLTAGEGGTTSLRVVGRDAEGTETGSEDVDLDGGTVAEVQLPDETASVTVLPGASGAAGAPVAGSLVTRRGDGTMIQPLRESVRASQVPQVRPGIG